MRELSIFIDESGDFGPFEKHAPYYVLSLVFHDQSDDITGHLDKIHQALLMRGLSENHAIHTGPLIRREHDYRLLDMPSRRAIFRVLVDFVRTCEVTHHSWVFSKRELGDTDKLVSAMSRELGELIRSNYAYFTSWERIVIYYDNGQKEITNLVNSVFNAHLSVEVRKVVPADYSLFQAADLCCTMALLRQKIERLAGCHRPSAASSQRPRTAPNARSRRATSRRWIANASGGSPSSRHSTARCVAKAWQQSRQSPSLSLVLLTPSVVGWADADGGADGEATVPQTRRAVRAHAVQAP